MIEKMTDIHANFKPIVIIGGGFAGLTAAINLRKSFSNLPILIVEPNIRFIFLPLLYEVLSNEISFWDVAPQYSSILKNSGITHILDSVKHINLEIEEIELSNGKTIKYSNLLIASGSSVYDFDIPGVNEYCYKFSSIDDYKNLERLLKTILQTDKDQSFNLCIIGGGPTGVELACKIADLTNDNVNLKIPLEL